MRGERRGSAPKRRAARPSGQTAPTTVPPLGPAAASHRPSRRAPVVLRQLLLPILVALTAFLVYAPTFSAGWTDTDDLELIADDAHFLKSDGAIVDAFRRPFFASTGRRTEYYRPLVTASFIVDAKYGTPPSPGPFHVTNAALHAAASLLVLALARALGGRPVVAAGAALLFAVHPAATQAVAWVPGRCDTLMACFALASLASWLRFEGTGARRWLLAHVVLFLAGLLSKEAGIAVLPLAVLCTGTVTRRFERLRSAGVWLVWGASLAVWAILRFLVEGSGPLARARSAHATWGDR